MKVECSPATAPLPSPQQAAALIRQRRTVNAFRPECPPADTIRRAIELARWAPNHHLTEPWHFYRIGEQTKAAVVELNAEIVTASKGPAAGEAKRRRWAGIPGWLAVSCDLSADPLRAWEDYAACACAIQNFSLYLWSEGIGVKWTTGAVIRDHRFYDLLWIDPDIEAVVGLVWYGYPDERPETHRRGLECSLVELP